MENSEAGSAFQLGPKMIGPGYPCFVIAEVGSNHDGDLEQAKALIESGEAAARVASFVEATRRVSG